MDLETLKDKLEDGQFSALSEYVKDLESQRDAARQESLDGKIKFKKMADERKRLSDEREKLFEKFGISEDTDLDSLPPASGQAEAAKQYEARTKRLERQLAEATAAREQAEGKYKGSLQKAAVSEAIGAHEFIARDLVETYVGQRLAWEGDDLLFKADDGRLMPIKDAVAGLAKSRPELLKPTGSGGAGVRPGNAGGSAGPKTMTRAAFDAMQPSEQMATAKAGVTLV